MIRAHRMPFGAEVLAGGGVCFRLWAPAAGRVDVVLDPDNGGTCHGMAHREEGWYEAIVADAEEGTHYAYRIDDALTVPDPASRHNPRDVHGASEVIDPHRFEWEETGWTGRPFEEAVFYELHVGTFTPEGSFAAVIDRLAALADLGITAIELMPVADFPGSHGWGYDGVLAYAPNSAYGHPDELKRLVQAAHRRGLMVFLDVVYNHFGPDGNYLHAYAPDFFSRRHHTPWGPAINFDGEGSRCVRDFFIHNALYWLEEYDIDGLRLDAVHAIMDDSEPDVLIELAEAVRDGPGRERQRHLVLENDHNAAHYLARDGNGEPRWYTAQWNDDTHHALHVLLTGEADGYYADYADAPLQQLGRCLTEGFAFQDDVSGFRGGARRGERSAQLPPTAFVNFLQNHDQIGNRAFGERIAALAGGPTLRLATAILLLSPSPPLLFMGQEFGCIEPFLYFCDFGQELGRAVREGRRNEFARFERFRDPVARKAIPDPNDVATCERSRPDWAAQSRTPHAQWLALHRELLKLRRSEIVPLLRRIHGNAGQYALHGDAGLRLRWMFGDGGALEMFVNFSEAAPLSIPSPAGRVIYAMAPEATRPGGDLLPPCSLVLSVTEAEDG